MSAGNQDLVHCTTETPPAAKEEEVEEFTLEL